MWMSTRILLLVTFFFSFAIQTTLACNGYILKVNYIRACSPDSIYQFDNFSINLDKDCYVRASGCIELKKPFKTATGKYFLKKPPMPPMEGDINFCEVAESMSDDRTVKDITTMMGFPNHCPIPQPKKGCASPDKKVSISKYKNQIGLASGTTELRLEIDHDTGKTCIESSITVKKGKRN